MENTDLDAFGYVYEHLIWNYTSNFRKFGVDNLNRIKTFGNAWNVWEEKY